MIIRVFPRRTKWTPNDDLSFVGDPPIINRPPGLPVSISCTFTWDLNECERLYRSWSKYYSNVLLGGPALNAYGEDFQPGRFIKGGVVITSRGCPKDCPWCFVPKREGKLREIPIKEGHIVQDNNLLACSNEHLVNVFEMLKRQSRGARFMGLDAEFLTDYHVELLDSIGVDQMFFSYDHCGNTYYIERASEMLSHYDRNKKRCYVLIGFNGESLKSAESRLMKIWDLGYLPFSMLYKNDDFRKQHYSKEWHDLTRIFSRPAITIGYCTKNKINDKNKQLTIF